MSLFAVQTKSKLSWIAQLRSNPTQQKYKHGGGIFGFFGTKDNLIDHYGKKLEDIEENLRLKQSEASLIAEEARAAFVFFKSRYGAASAFHLQPSINPTQWITEPAPQPHDVYWPFFSESFMKQWISKKFVTQVITGYLPSLILQMSLKLVPPVMGFLSSIQGYISHIFHQLEVILDLRDITGKLAVAVPAQ
ncbi:ERD (early-responsive to dehydration stress) family protein, partial [Trifolium medium]|nr:ERD (early-responsive to dehydration stress) family protein [Trifolium medium]